MRLFGVLKRTDTRIILALGVFLALAPLISKPAVVSYERLALSGTSVILIPWLNSTHSKPRPAISLIIS